MTKKKISAPALRAGVTITTLTPFSVDGGQAVVFAHLFHEKRAEKFDFDTTAMKFWVWNEAIIICFPQHASFSSYSVLFNAEILMFFLSLSTAPQIHVQLGRGCNPSASRRHE